MANWSDYTVELNGKPEDIKNAFEELNLNLDTDKYQYNDVDLGDDVSIELQGDTCILIYGEGRWEGPSDYIKEVVKRHTLSGCYTDMEPGMNWCHLIVFKDGKVVNEESDEYFSDLSITMTGVSYMVDYMSWIPEEENWEVKYQSYIALFEKHGMTLDQLKLEWEEIGVEIVS